MKKWIFLALVAAVVSAWFTLDLGSYLSLEGMKSARDEAQAFYQQSPLGALLAYFVIYVVMAAFSIPGAGLMSLLGGAIFGLVAGTVATSFASTLGATFAMLISRSLFHDAVAERFKDTYKKINTGVDKDGAMYLFGLRLVPAFPFFAINLVMGLTRMKALRFYWVSQLGMLPATIVYVNAGTQLGQIEQLSDIGSPTITASFILLAFFPFVARKILDRIKAMQAYRGWEKPQTFDRNMVVIGAGAAGLVTSYIAAAVKAKVTLIEKHEMGGDCLNTGCVPSKAIIRSARIAKYMQRADQFGVKAVSAGVDFPKVMKRVHRIIADVAPHDSVERYTGLGVDVIKGEANIISPWQVEVDGNVLNTKSIVIASGGAPTVPSVPGLEQVNYLTSDTLWQIDTLPKKLIVMGSGPIGCELALAFRRLGAEVTVIGPRLLPRDDEDVSDMIHERFVAEGIEVLSGYKVTAAVQENNDITVTCEAEGQAAQTVTGDTLLVAVGRTARTQGLGLENIDIALRDNGTVETNEFLQTRFPNIYACGDVTGPFQFTHAAAHQAWYASVNALFGFAKKFAVDYRCVPYATFTDPEVARVGLNETDAKAQSVEYEVTRYGLDDLDRAIADDEAHGFVKVLTVPGKDKILGVTIVGYHASDLIAEYVLAMKNNLGLNKVLRTIHAYPTLMEANKYVAGEWKRAHAPEKLLGWVEKFHAWRLK